MSNEFIVTQTITTFDKSKLKKGMPIHFKDFIGGTKSYDGLIIEVKDTMLDVYIFSNEEFKNYDICISDVEEGNIKIYPLAVVKEQTANEANIVNHLRAIKNYCRNHNCKSCRFGVEPCLLKDTTPNVWNV